MGTETGIPEYEDGDKLIDKRKVPGGDGNKCNHAVASIPPLIDKRKVPGGDGNITSRISWRVFVMYR